jgi:hypothetical protein
MESNQTDRCQICGNIKRQIHFNGPRTWCWNCEPYRPEAAILPALKPGNIERTLNTVPLEFLKAVILIAIGYAWAVKAYGIFPGG